MYSKTPQKTMKKRSLEESSIERPRKSPFGHVKFENGLSNETKTFKFRVLMPNSIALELKISDPPTEMPVEEFLDVVKKEYFAVVKQRSYEQQKRKINWNYQDLHFTDVNAKKIRIKVDFRNLLLNEWHILCLHDGSPEPDTYEGMWDLTPDTDLLKELPDDYTFETALADLIDNSLQALWSNGKGEDRFISVEWHPDRLSIFDSGPGMDGTDGNLVKWGKIGASLHRSARGQAIGGKPPYLTPFFGMFGYGGPVATMCLGRRAVVSSKTKNCNKVFTLHLEREALMNASRSENCWRTKGGIRDPSEDESKNSRHGSFTKVEIFEPKMKTQDVKHLQSKLKDIYFPYIQFDDMSGKTRRLIDFEVNGENLAAILGGEVATTNSHSCNGPDFVVQLRFRINQDPSSVHGQSQRVLLEANARLKCVYFPIVEGKESINTIIDELQAAGWEIRESFESFSRVAVRRLGRLLPDARWALLPYMEPKQKKGEKAQVLKRCCSRVKCFIDTDSGFNPTPHKTDLSQHHPYTKALKNFGNRAPENEKEVQIEITRDGKNLTLQQLEKLYTDWVSDMHDCYDEEIDGGLDEPTLVIVSSKIKKLDTSSGVVLRVHKKIQRRGMCWTAGDKIKVLKGACTGVHKNNIFATLEYVILEGLQGDAGGEARLICRPIGLPEDRGCQLLNDNGNKTIDIRDSLALPIRVIDSEKCLPADETEWKNKLHAYRQKLPSVINLLSHIHCQELEIQGGLPNVVEAGDATPENIVAVIRPKAYDSGNTSKSLDQKFIVKDKHVMSVEVKFIAGDKNVGNGERVFSMSQSTSSHKGLHGLYIFPVKRHQLFEKAGFYTFSFAVGELKDIRFEQGVKVQASAGVGSWKILSHKMDELYTIRVGSCFEPLSVVCYDRYDKCVVFTSVPKLTIKLISNSTVLAGVPSMKVDLTTDKSIMKIKGIVVKSSKLDDIRPDYEATLDISTLDEAFSVAFPCRVLPGTPQRIAVHPRQLRKQLIPGQIIEKLILEVLDEYGNHAKEDEIILLSVDGFSFHDGSSVVHTEGYYLKKVNANGCVDLSNILKVSKGYGKDVSLSVISEEREVILKLNFQIETRKLRSMPKVFKNCEAGSQLENIVFEIVNSEGKVDESIHDEEKHGQSHTLTIKSNSFDIDDSIRYSFRRGRCTIRSIHLPHTEGTYSFSAIYSRFPDLNLDIEVHVIKALEENRELTVNHEDVGNPVLSPRNSCENSQIPPHSPLLRDLRMGNKNFSPLSIEYASPIGYSPLVKAPKLEDTNAQNKNIDILPVQVLASQDVGNLKELEDDLASWGSKRVVHQRKLVILNNSKSKIQQQVSDLQASIARNNPNMSSMFGHEWILEQIKSKSQSAAAVICKLLEDFESKPRDILGVVALIGTTQSIELSRILAQYLGEDLMLAVVCENYSAAHEFETNTLHKLASKVGQQICGGYLALCLDDIRPSIRGPSIGPQNLLPLPPPTFPGGDVPQGFLGYAVNLISMETSYLQWRTKSGHGLREILFYRLFGELQVYRDRECMMMAKSCIKDGGVSLDGGILKGKGLVSFGHWEPVIVFAVKNSTVPQSSRTLLLLEESKLELTEINQQIDKETASYEKVEEQFVKSRDRYNSHRVSQNGLSAA